MGSQVCGLSTARPRSTSWPYGCTGRTSAGPSTILAQWPSPHPHTPLIRLTIQNDIGGCIQWIADFGDAGGLDAQPSLGGGGGVGSSALHYACSRGHCEIAELLLQSGASANVTNHTGCTPLHYPVFAQQDKILRLLLEHGAEASFNIKGESRLWDSPRTPAELAKLMIELTRKRACEIE